MELIGRHGELVDLEEIEGRVALEGALPYPPGLLCIQPGERWAPTVTKYFQILLDGINKMPGFEPEIQGVSATTFSSTPHGLVTNSSFR